ncbi:CENP-B protein [Calocera cornea HHB12733]|uniref:CENP-B protein n=1 Tax=Calocera cornea HHB12733 TaxID=1353952 RepID=A0A165DSP3_9BASI|nr:CENP-B protein [Calocera cornea HHB12733]
MQAIYGVQPGNFYNFDETGFAMGVIRAAVIIAGVDRSAKPKAIQAGNREWVMAICCIAADGFVVLPFLCMVRHNHLATWYVDGSILPTWVVAPTNKGWTDNATGLAWLQHFNIHTKN